jgi:translation initiation factor 2B subunit (eIF-2B alpha/beta/delta family)
MKISIFPEEIIKRCLWDTYVYYIVGSEKEAEKILKENLEIEVSERDALVMGLLKVVETTNLIHRFNTHITEFLTNKSIKDKDGLLVRKRTLDLSVDKFLDKFPDYWEPNSAWVNSLKELVIYIDEIKISIEKLEITQIEDKNVIYEFYNSNQVKKLLKFNY